MPWARAKRRAVLRPRPVARLVSDWDWPPASLAAEQNLHRARALRDHTGRQHGAEIMASVLRLAGEAGDRGPLARDCPRRQGDTRRPRPGNPGSAGEAQCHIQTGYWNRALVPARRAARPAASRSGYWSPSHGARHRSYPSTSGPSAAASSLLRPASPLPCNPRRTTSAAWALRARNAAAVSVVRRWARVAGGSQSPVRALSVGHRHQPQPCPRRRQHRGQAADAEHLVIRVRRGAVARGVQLARLRRRRVRRAPSAKRTSIVPAGCEEDQEQAGPPLRNYTVAARSRS